MNKLSRWFSVLLLAVTLCLSGCYKVAILDINSMPSVISASKEMSKEDAVAKLQSIVNVSYLRCPETVTANTNGFTAFEETKKIKSYVYQMGYYMPKYESGTIIVNHRTIAFEDIAYVGQVNHFGIWLYVYGQGSDPSKPPKNHTFIILADTSLRKKEFLTALYVLCPNLRK